MMPLRRFEIHRPAGIAEASKMLKEFGDEGRLHAGGTELLLAELVDDYEGRVDYKRNLIRVYLRRAYDK